MSGGETASSVIWFPLCSEPLPELTDQANLPLRAGAARQERAFPVIWCSTLLKTEHGVAAAARCCEKKKSRGCHHFILIPSPSTPSHSLIPLMRSVQAEACSRRQQFYSAICASHIGWQGGEKGSVGSAAEAKGRGEGKWNPEWAAAIPCGVLSAASCLFCFSQAQIVH